MEYALGFVWKDTKYRLKPWCVQGPSSIARYKTKKAAVWVSELFLKDRADLNPDVATFVPKVEEKPEFGELLQEMFGDAFGEFIRGPI